MVDLKEAADLTLPERGELDMVFAFEHMECDQVGVKWFKTKFKPKKLMKILTKWQEGLPWNSCYFENHDQPRSVTRFTEGGEFREVGSKMLLGLLFSLRGTTYVYQGQEIGMTNGAFGSLDEIVDIESHNVDKMAKKLGIINPFRWKMIKATSRDNARTPMQWNAGENAGFTNGKPWLKLHPNYTEVNVESDLKNDNGVISFFRAVNSYKKSSEILKEGSFKELAATKHVYVFERELDGKKLTAICNFSTKKSAYPVNVEGERVLSNYEGSDKKLRPYEFVLIENK